MTPVIRDDLATVALVVLAFCSAVIVLGFLWALVAPDVEDRRNRRAYVHRGIRDIERHLS